TWPEAHYLGALHPVLDWAADRALSRLDRNAILAVRGGVDSPTVLLVGTLSNQRGQVVASSFASVEFPNPDNHAFRLLSVHGSAAEMIDAVGLAERRSNVGAVAGLGDLSALIRPAVLAAQAELDQLFDAAATAAQEKVARWSERIASWDREPADLAQRLELRLRRLSVEQEKELV